MQTLKLVRDIHHTNPYGYTTIMIVIHALKKFLIQKDFIVKLQYQLAFFFKTLKFSIEMRRAFLLHGGLYWSKVCFNNNFWTLDNKICFPTGC